MLRKVLLFGAGALFGAYVMENHLYRKISKVIIEHSNEKSEEAKTSETEKES